MPGLLTAIRRTSLVVSGAISLIAAVLLAERIIRPGIIEDFGTVALLGLLMLFLLPAATLLALRHDRRQMLDAVGRERADAAARLILAAERGADPAFQPASDPANAILLDPRSVRHGAHARSAGRSAEGPTPTGVPVAGDRVHEPVA